MSSIFMIARWEWFKLQRRLMPWILLAILFGFSQLSVWGTYVAYSFTTANGGVAVLPRATAGRPVTIRCADLQKDAASAVPAGTSAQDIVALNVQCQQRLSGLAARYLSLAPSRAVSTALGIAASVGLILVAILSASVIGIEFGLGTLRPILARGAGRLQFLAGKYLMLIGAIAAALLVVAVASAGSGLAAITLAHPPPDVGHVGVSLGHVAIAYLKTLAGLITFMTIAASVTLLVRSTAAGMAIALAWLAAESILVRLLSALFDWFNDIAEYLPMRNISAFTSDRSSLQGMLNNVVGNSISPLHAGLVMAGYVVLFAGIAALVFRKRDITGASGGG
jgi:ABC-2 type transport system permease protein